MRGLIPVFALALVAALGVSTADASDMELPAGPGRDLVYGQCRTCHDLQYLHESAGITRDDWDQIIISMRQYGLRIPEEQRAKILDYLGTYLGPNPPKASEVAKVAPGRDTAADGRSIYQEQCQACHQANGKGLAGQFPPLAGNPDLFRDRALATYVVLNGLQGRIEVNSQTYNSAMPPFDHLKDGQIIAVLDYVRSAWGNDALRPPGFGNSTATDVARARERKMTPEQVLDYRAQIK